MSQNCSGLSLRRPFIHIETLVEALVIIRQAHSLIADVTLFRDILALQQSSCPGSELRDNPGLTQFLPPHLRVQLLPPPPHSSRELPGYL